MLWSPIVSAHGGVSVEDDVCIMKIGIYKAHFTGYVPVERASQEFCEDIPVVSDSVFVLDFISDELREMEIDFRIVRDVKHIGVSATYADLGNVDEIESATIHYTQKKRHPNGVLSTNYRFVEEGEYIGIVEAKYDALNITYHSVFPFRVGRTDYSEYVIYYLLLFGFCGLFVYMAGRRSFFSDD